jgi:hypothetical protein
MWFFPSPVKVISNVFPFYLAAHLNLNRIWTHTDTSESSSCSEFSRLNDIHFALVLITKYKKDAVLCADFRGDKASHQADFKH